jgi:REP element-mobilizing transposase RayT
VTIPQEHRRGRHAVSALYIHLIFVMRERHIMHGHFWSPSYFAASCGGAPLSIIKEYTENQKRPDQGIEAMRRRSAPPR